MRYQSLDLILSRRLKIQSNSMLRALAITVPVLLGLSLVPVTAERGSPVPEQELSGTPHEKSDYFLPEKSKGVKDLGGDVAVPVDFSAILEPGPEMDNKEASKQGKDGNAALAFDGKGQNAFKRVAPSNEKEVKRHNDPAALLLTYEEAEPATANDDPYEQEAQRLMAKKTSLMQ